MSALLNTKQLQEETGLATVECHDQLGSTMDRGRELAASSSVLPALITANRQHAGRGRRGAAWWQLPGSLAMTLVLDASQTVDLTGGLLPLWAPACGLAVAEAIKICHPAIQPQVRWPNDVEVHGRKLAGVLVEATTRHRVLVGIGMNTTGSAKAAPAELRERLTTLPDAVGKELPADILLKTIVIQTLAAVAATGTLAGRSEIIQRYQRYCSLTNRPITLYDVLAEKLYQQAHATPHLRTSRLTGHCQGIDEFGRLLVETSAGPLAIIAGSLTNPTAIWNGKDSAANG